MADSISPADFGGTLRFAVRAIEDAQYDASRVALALHGLGNLMLVDGSLATNGGCLSMTRRDELTALCGILADKLTADLERIDQQIAILIKEMAA